MGAGHTVVAQELARRLTARGADCEVADLLELAGSAGARLRRTYRSVLATAPWLYDGAMRFWSRAPRLVEAAMATSGRPFRRALAAALARAQPDLVVATYNLAAQQLGRLLPRWPEDVALLTYVTDPGPHPYWVSPNAAVHLAVSPFTADGLRRYGARRVEVVQPVLRADFAHPPARADARARLRLPQDAAVALVNGGSWAAGRLLDTVRVLLAAGGCRPVVLCGRDTSLQERMRSVPGVLTVPWTTEIPQWLAAADVLIDNAGGQTCFEALASGTPVVIYRPLPGHGRINAEALAAMRFAAYARTPDELTSAITNPGRVPVFDGRDAADVVMDVLAHRKTSR